MTNIILLGGNGYIGREVTKQWLEKDSQAEFYVVSRSGKNQLEHPRVHNISANVNDYNSVIKLLPKTIDFIVDFVGRPEKDAKLLVEINETPAKVMLKIAQNYNIKAMGFIGGVLGPKSFTDIKSNIIKMLQASRKRVEYVEPTIVYGGGRTDTLSKMIPIFKFLGIFSKKMKPIQVEEVANKLISKLTQ
ncbi:NAD-dependent epimerase/dehydratase family protein [Peribacillus sp. NPDC096379]|uniref:NAD-dependent epimerase/dehydratase family protein n=1 Tax=Peribacillus sp. NPDC096379 TaxID=3364393 RepID=UPI003811A492